MYGAISFVLAERRKVADQTFHSALLARRIVLLIKVFGRSTPQPTRPTASGRRRP